MPQNRHEPEDVARQVALSVASEPEEVGEFLRQHQLEDGVSEFQFASKIKGYEGWLWSVTLYHDKDSDQWTVDESSLIPGPDALLPPPWIPWKDRLLPSDLSVTDAMGTEPDDPRLEDGWSSAEEAQVGKSEHSTEQPPLLEQQDGVVFKRIQPEAGSKQSSSDSWIHTAAEDVDSAVQEFALSRRHVLTAQGRDATAKRWYEGQHGPKSLSTRTAAGNTCETCGFMVAIQGSLGTMFGVCANRWSPDDGRVVALDHGCGEHSEIEPPEIGRLWEQSKPAFDDLRIDVVHQAPREEISAVELIEEINNEGE